MDGVAAHRTGLAARAGVVLATVLGGLLAPTVAAPAARADGGPVATADAYTTGTGQTLSQPAPGVLANDTGPAGDALAAQETSGPADGSLTLNADGSFTYTPVTGFVGVDGFDYQACDQVTTLCSAPVAVSLTVQATPTLTASLAGDGTAGSAVTVAAGAAVSATATLSGAEPGAGGVLTYTLYADAGCLHPVAAGGSVAVSNGVAGASQPVPLASPGTYYWGVAYDGDTLDAAATACEAAAETVQPVDLRAVLRVGAEPRLAHTSVTIASAALAAACGSLTYDTLQGGTVAAPAQHRGTVTVTLDADANAVVTVIGTDCVPVLARVQATIGTTPFPAGTAVLDVRAPRTGRFGLTASPGDAVAVGVAGAGNLSESATVFTVQTNPIYAGDRVEIDSAQLVGRCLQGASWQTDDPASPFLDSATASATVDPTGSATFLFDGGSCAAGAPKVTAVLLAGHYPGYVGTFPILAPRPTWHTGEAKVVLALAPTQLVG